MVTVTFDELEFNAVAAALDDRVNRMSAQLARLSEQPKSQSRDFAIDATREAIRHALRAQLDLAASVPDPEYPGDMTIDRLDDANPSNVTLAAVFGGTWSVLEQYQGETR